MVDITDLNSLGGIDKVVKSPVTKKPKSKTKQPRKPKDKDIKDGTIENNQESALPSGNAADTENLLPSNSEKDSSSQSTGINSSQEETGQEEEIVAPTISEVVQKN